LNCIKQTILRIIALYLQKIGSQIARQSNLNLAILMIFRTFNPPGLRNGSLLFVSYQNFFFSMYTYGFSLIRVVFPVSLLSVQIPSLIKRNIMTFTISIYMFDDK